jgi:hypothetical protein
MRRTLSLIMLAVLAPALSAQNPPAAATDSTPRRTVEFSGMVLVNGFFTNSRTNNSDVPQVVENDTLGVAGSGGTIRQTRLGVFVTDPDVLGGSFSGELDADFQASNRLRADVPLLRSVAPSARCSGRTCDCSSGRKARSWRSARPARSRRSGSPTLPAPGTCGSGFPRHA